MIEVLVGVLSYTVYVLVSLLVFQLSLWWFAPYCAVSVVAFVAFYVDKKAAIKHQRRVPESTLYIMSLLGGWPGALLAQCVFRHKTKKRSFRRAFWLIVVLNALILSALVWMFGNNPF